MTHLNESPDREPEEDAETGPETDVGILAEWEREYTETAQKWSGRANKVLVDTVAGLAPGSSLDVGCGEGADVVWLAMHGWRADGLDLSPTAINRARAAAQAAHVDGARFHAGDLTEWGPNRVRSYDLVTAFFLHPRGGADRQELLQRAAEFVAPGGGLLIVSHASMPPWAQHAHPAGDEHDERAPITPESDRELLGTGDDWATEIAEIRLRPATGPDGEEAVLDDSVLLLRRL